MRTNFLENGHSRKFMNAKSLKIGTDESLTVVALSEARAIAKAILSARWQLISNLLECVCDHWLIVYLNTTNRCFLVSTPIIRTIGRLNENTQNFHSRKFMRAKSLKIVPSRKLRAKCTICSFAKVYARESFSRESFSARKFLHSRGYTYTHIREIIVD